MSVVEDWQQAGTVRESYEDICARKDMLSGIDAGMTLRDYFAAKAMQGMARGEYSTWGDLAIDAYAIADAMLKERNK